MGVEGDDGAPMIVIFGRGVSEAKKGGEGFCKGVCASSPDLAEQKTIAHAKGGAVSGSFWKAHLVGKDGHMSNRRRCVSWRESSRG